MPSSKVNKLKRTAENEKNVKWNLFYQQLAEAFSERGWNDNTIIDIVYKLFQVGIYDQKDSEENEAGLKLFERKELLKLPGLPKPAPPVQTFAFNVSYKNKKGTTSEKTLTVEERHMTCAFIYKEIQGLFNTKLARLYIRVNGDEFTQAKLQELLADSPARQIRLSVVNVQRGFSSFHDIDDAVRLVGPNGKLEKDVDFFAVPHSLDGCNDEVDLAFRCIQVLEPILSLTGACEATKRIFIDPILVAAARVVKAVQMEVEREVESADANGPVDYIFKYEGRTICVTEGKYASQDSGVSQNLAQLTAVREETSRKRKASEISDDERFMPIYGIATTYVEWQFLVLDGDTVRISKHYLCDGSDKESVTKIIAMVAAVLGTKQRKAGSPIHADYILPINDR